MADLVFTDVPGRVAKALLDLADRFGEEQEDGLQVHHDLTQEELAQLVGASRETVNKALADFAARGWLQLSAKSVLILDRERLAKARPQGDGRRAPPVSRMTPGGSAPRYSPGTELRRGRQCGERPERTVHVRVDAGDDLGRGAVAGGQRGGHLGQPLPAVCEVVVERAGRIR